MAKYELVCWPECQDLMECEGFEENASLAVDEGEYGSSAYFVDADWLHSINTKKAEETGIDSSICYGRDDLLAVAEDIANALGNINIAEELCERMARAGAEFINELALGGVFSYTRINPE